MVFQPVESVRPPQSKQASEAPDPKFLAKQVHKLVVNPILSFNCSVEEQDTFFRKASCIIQEQLVDYSVDPIESDIVNA